ncbi:hypothetical protein [Vibrio anguillarum]|uniref:Uncharacterized protein n=1 Tax=Vibrio anguillarum TaxID=55601 RepID=A0ABR9Z7G3_VIBAN|nr:hypothetical protein [Vibrio anguillarum]MBF4374400.1 hypothetical protein [Vibrio anguillarum]
MHEEIQTTPTKSQSEKEVQECLDLIISLDNDSAIDDVPIPNSIVSIKAKRLYNACIHHRNIELATKIAQSMSAAELRYRNMYLTRHYDVLLKPWDPERSYLTTFETVKDKLLVEYKARTDNEEKARVVQRWLRESIENFGYSLLSAQSQFVAHLSVLSQSDMAHYCAHSRLHPIKLIKSINYLENGKLITLTPQQRKQTQVLRSLIQY